MKTLTEFPAINLKNAVKVRNDLMQQGKTPEELPAALGESLKLEGDKLNWLTQAIELLGTKVQDLKRVVVYSLTEGEKVPPGVVQKGDQCYLVEYYPSLAKELPARDSGRDRKGKDRGGKGRDKKRGGQGGGGRDRGPRAPRAEGTAMGDHRPPRQDMPRSDRPARPPRPAQTDPNTPAPRPVPSVGGRVIAPVTAPKVDVSVEEKKSQES